MRIDRDPIKEAEMARKKREAQDKKQKSKGSQRTLASFFTGAAQSFAGVQARLDRRAPDTPGRALPMTEHEQHLGSGFHLHHVTVTKVASPLT